MVDARRGSAARVGRDDDFSADVGAFLVSGVLIVLTGMWPALGRAITQIPKPIASAMLAGILFPICVAPVPASPRAGPGPAVNPSFRHPSC